MENKEMEKEENPKQTYANYDFRNCPKWKKYIGSLYPTPPLNKIEKFRRKFYKREIDPEFDVTSE